MISATANGFGAVVGLARIGSKVQQVNCKKNLLRDKQNDLVVEMFAVVQPYFV